VRPIQQLLFPDPRPLVERLGRDFFRQLPLCPGVYLMRDAADAILYVGKAKNLRKRLGSYRVANPDRMARRHLRLLRAVVRIEIQECASESCALARESELLRTLRPKFNRSGTWAPPPRFLAWQAAEERISLAVLQTPATDWRLEKARGTGATMLRAILARLLWLAVYPQFGLAGLPVGWLDGKLAAETVIHCGPLSVAVKENLQKIFIGRSNGFCEWIRARQMNDLQPFERAWIEAELEFLEAAFPPLHSELKPTASETFPKVMRPEFEDNDSVEPRDRVVEDQT